MVDFIVWFFPRIVLWIALSWYPWSKIMALSSYGRDSENLGKIASLYFIIFFVIAPICFYICYGT